MPFQASGEAIYKGLIPGHDQDSSIAGFIHGDFSEDFSRSISVNHKDRREQEIGLEAGYRVKLNDWAYIQPDVQYPAPPLAATTWENVLIIVSRERINIDTPAPCGCCNA